VGAAGQPGYACAAAHERIATMTYTHHTPPLTACRLAAWAFAFYALGVGAGAGLGHAAQAPPKPAQAEPVGMVASPDGSFVVDERLRLAWARCVEGMQWNGKTCTGTPLMLDRAQARARAAERWKAEGLDWRLPRAPELQHLVNKSAQPPGPDAVLFPAAPLDWYWTSTTDVKSVQESQYTYGNVMQSRSGGSGANQMSFLHGWAVHLRSGETRKDMGKDAKLPVRLVRTWVAP
jgi:hypothetical protein